MNARDDFAPEPAGFEHVGFVDRGELSRGARAPRRTLKSCDAFDLSHGVDALIAGKLSAVRRLSPKVEPAGQFAEDDEINVGDDARAGVGS